MCVFKSSPSACCCVIPACGVFWGPLVYPSCKFLVAKVLVSSLLFVFISIYIYIYLYFHFEYIVTVNNAASFSSLKTSINGSRVVMT